MSRTQAMLSGLLLLQLLLIVALRSPFSDASTTTEPRALFPALEAFTPAKLEVLGAEDERITLVREQDTWRIEQVGGFPADATKIDGLLDDLRSIRVRRPVVTSKRYHDTFKVAEDQREARLKVWNENGDDPAVDLILGTSPNYGITHARRADEDAVYEIRDVAPYDVRADAGAWAELQLTDVDTARVTALTLTNRAGSFELRKVDGVWTAEGDETELDQAAVESLVSKAGALRLAGATGPVDPAAHGFDDPAATVVVRWGEGDEASEVTLQIGRNPEEEESRRFVTRSGLAYTGTVWESSVKPLLEKTLGDLHAGSDVSG